jgi:hypothetical protein
MLHYFSFKFSTQKFILLSQLLMMMLDNWIGDLESRVVNGLTDNQRLFLSEIKKRGEYIGELKIQSESNFKEQLFCYVPGLQQGWVIEKDEKGLGAVISYGGLSKDEFTRRYYPFAAKEAEQKKGEMKKKVKKYSLISLPVVIIPAIYLGVKKFLEKKSKGQRQE